MYVQTRDLYPTGLRHVKICVTLVMSETNPQYFVTKAGEQAARPNLFSLSIFIFDFTMKSSAFSFLKLTFFPFLPLRHCASSEAGGKILDLSLRVSSLAPLERMQNISKPHFLTWIVFSLHRNWDNGLMGCSSWLQVRLPH